MTLSSQPPLLSIVVPCFNEEAVLAETHARLSVVLARLAAVGKVSRDSELVFVDDGSRDATWAMISRWARSGSHVTGVKLSRNCGHQNALLAGMNAAKGDAVVTIDADLQDDETAIGPMVDAFRDGHEIVYGVRCARDCDTWFKRHTARGFYRLMGRLGVKTVFDHADYRLMSRRAVRELAGFQEVHLFLRGIVPLLGLRSTTVHYERRERFAGESKYPLRRMIEFALNGVTSFSIAPLRAISALGLAVAFACAGFAAWAVAAKILGDAVPGWASTILPIYFLGGVQLFCIGVLGEYIGRIYMEAKRRPRYFVEQTVKATARAESAVPRAVHDVGQLLATRPRTRPRRAPSTPRSVPQGNGRLTSARRVRA